MIDRPDSSAWYRQPVLWLGIAIFVASLAGCIWMIVLGERYADEALPDAGTTIMKVPLERKPAPDALKSAQISRMPGPFQSVRSPG